MKWIENNWFKLIIALALLLSGIAIFYYFVVYLPYVHDCEVSVEAVKRLDLTPNDPKDPLNLFKD